MVISGGKSGPVQVPRHTTGEKINAGHSLSKLVTGTRIFEQIGDGRREHVQQSCVSLRCKPQQVRKSYPGKILVARK